MAEIELVWLNEKRFVGIDSSKHSVVIAPPGDIGAKPSDLLLISLAACTAYDVVGIVEKRRARLQRLVVHVAGEQEAEAPWAYRAIHLHFDATASGLDDAQLRRAVDLSLNKYCSVRASLSPDIVVTFDVTLAAPELSVA